MKLPFLSNEWFDRVEALTAAAGALGIPEEATAINLTITGAGAPTHAHLRSGLFARGHHPAAGLTMTCPPSVANTIFIENDPARGMQAFFLGEATFEGDVEAIVAAAERDPERSEATVRLIEQIQAITGPPTGATPRPTPSAKRKVKAKAAKATAKPAKAKPAKAKPAKAKPAKAKPAKAKPAKAKRKN